MPIYEYVCRACGHEFEKLVRGASPAAPACIACGGAGAERLLSLPAVQSESTHALAMRAAKQRDRAQATERVNAQRAYEKSHDD